MFKTSLIGADVHLEPAVSVKHITSSLISNSIKLEVVHNQFGLIVKYVRARNRWA
jgi:hypothetical protein